MKSSQPVREYRTRFGVDEEPLSEGGLWLNGKTDGVDWTDVISRGGVAFGAVSRMGVAEQRGEPLGECPHVRRRCVRPRVQIRRCKHERRSRSPILRSRDLLRLVDRPSNVSDPRRDSCVCMNAEGAPISDSAAALRSPEV